MDQRLIEALIGQLEEERMVEVLTDGWTGISCYFLCFI